MRTTQSSGASFVSQSLKPVVFCFFFPQKCGEKGSGGGTQKHMHASRTTLQTHTHTNTSTQLAHIQAPRGRPQALPPRHHHPTHSHAHKTSYITDLPPFPPITSFLPLVFSARLYLLLSYVPPSASIAAHLVVIPSGSAGVCDVF